MSATHPKGPTSLLHVNVPARLSKVREAVQLSYDALEQADGAGTYHQRRAFDAVVALTQAVDGLTEVILELDRRKLPTEARERQELSRGRS